MSRLHKEDFQAVDISAIAAPVTKMAMTVLEPGQVPGAFAKAFHLMRSGRPGPVLIDLPIDVQLARSISTPRPISRCPCTSRWRPVGRRTRPRLDDVRRATPDRRRRRRQRRRLGALVELAEILNVPVVPTLMGWGTIPDDHRLAAGMAGLQTAHRYGNATMLASDFVLGIGNRWANRHTVGLEPTAGESVSFTSTSSPPRSVASSRPTSGSSPTPGPPSSVRRLRARAPLRSTLTDWNTWAEECQDRKRTMRRKTHFDDVPIKPQRVYEEMNRAFGRDARYVTAIGLSQILPGQFLQVFKPRELDQLRPGRAVGVDGAAALGVATADPDATVVGTVW